MAAEVPIDLTYAIYSLLFEGGSYDWTKLLDPWGIFGIAGRPRDEATEEVVNRLESSPNPAARLWGIELARGLNQFGLVISTSGSGRAILNAWYSQFVANMVAQGVSQTRAQEIGLHAMSTAAQQGAALEPELQAPLAQGLTFNGPQAIADTFLQGIKVWNKQGFTGQELIDKAENYTLKNSTVANLTALRLGQPAPGQQTLPTSTTGVYANSGTCQAGFQYEPDTQLCWPIPPPTQPTPGCPPGQHWDPIQLKCVPDTVPPPVIPPPQPPGNGGPDPEGDELTNTLCAQIQSAADRVVAAVGGTTSGPGGSIDFTPVINAIEDVVNVLTAISTTLPTLGAPTSPPIDLSGVITAIDSLVAAIGAIPGTGAIDLTPIVNALNAIAAKIPPAGGTDESAEAAAIKAQTAEFTVSKAVGDALVARGYIDKQVAQNIVGGESGDWGLAALASHLPASIKTFLVGFTGFDLDSGKPLALDTGALTSAIGSALSAYLKQTDTVVEPVITGLLDTIKNQVAPGNTPPLGSAGVDQDTAIQSVLSTTITAKIAMAIASYVGWDIGEHTEKLAEVISSAVGYEEMRDVQIGPLVEHGIAKVADMNARALFQQEIPGVGQVTDLVARGILDQGTANLLLGWNGLHTSLRRQVQAAAYSGLNARQMLRLAGTGLFSQGDITDELTFSGMRPASQRRMLLAAPWLATKPERDQLKATLEKSYVAGLIGDADLHQQLDELDQNVDRDALVMARVQLEKRIAFAKELENAYTIQFRANVIDGAQLQSFLSGLGLQQDFINNRIAYEQAKDISEIARRAAAEARALERTTLAEERRAAVRNFKQGNIDQVALAAALTLTGLSPAQLVAWVDLAVLEKAGSLRWIFGQQLSPAQASLLRARVTALTDQRKRQELTDPAFVAALTALNIPPHFINSIRAAADALVSPKTAAVTIPVETG